MIEILERATNARGQIVLRTTAKGWNKEIVTLRDGQTEQQWLAEAREQEARAEGQRLIAAEDAAIEREVMGAGAGVVAVQDVRTGKARAFVEPARLDDTPVDATTGPPQRGGTATERLRQGATRRQELEMQLSALQLILTDKSSSEGARRMARADIAKLQRILAAPDLPGNSATEGRVPKQQSDEDQLAALKTEMTQLLKALDDPATGPDDRAHAAARLDQVRQEIMDHGRRVPFAKTA